MTTSMALLGLLADGPKHGYDLKRAYDERFPQARPLAYGQVYATLARLARGGLIDVTEVAAHSGPERTVYDLTGVGSREVREWIGRPEPPVPHVINELFTKVVVALLVGGSARDYLRLQRATHMERMRELTAVKVDPRSSVADVLSVDFALTHLDADLRWMDTAVARLAELGTEVAA